MATALVSAYISREKTKERKTLVLTCVDDKVKMTVHTLILTVHAQFRPFRVGYVIMNNKIKMIDEIQNK